MENKIYKQLLKGEAEKLKVIHIPEDAYNLWISSEVYIEYADFLTQDELNLIFSKPKEVQIDDLENRNEFGDKFAEDVEEYSPPNIDLSNIELQGWLANKQKKESLTESDLYKNVVFRGIGNMEEDVRRDITNQALCILDKCNNPRGWEETDDGFYSKPGWKVSGAEGRYKKNKQGLVYGMVQSGKTASMISLMGLAIESGYNLIIVLSGDKTSLRDQTQDRINKAFQLRDSTGTSRNPKYKIRSITKIKDDYVDSIGRVNSGLDVYADDVKSGNRLIICVKKNQSPLKRLISDLKDLQETKPQSRVSKDFNYPDYFKALIIDDEADYASQNTKKHGKSPMHETIENLRTQINQNTYIAYTATPQACLSADVKSLVGYPKDFIWLLEPFQDKSRNNISYLGLEEYFSLYRSHLINELSEHSWPHWKKDISGKKEGILITTNNGGGTIVIPDHSLVEAERNHLEELINDIEYRKKKGFEYKTAIADFLITTALRWWRHYIKNREQFFSNKKPTKKQISGFQEITSATQNSRCEPFPYHAMMFNLAYINEIQRELLEFVQITFQEVVSDFAQTKGKWNTDTIFKQQYEKQKEKSYKLNDSDIPDPLSLEYFIDCAIDISSQIITNSDKYIYILNSSDDGQVLNYSTKDETAKPKKAAIIVGGLILSRGLTIENLSTSVYVRSQSQSLGDTNLQMCRWFGHKKTDIDLISVYMQGHSIDLFDQINDADKQLRAQFRKFIFYNYPAECILLEMQNSPLFKITSPSKSRFIQKTDKSSFIGTSRLITPRMDEDWIENNKLLDDFLENKESKTQHNRAKLYENIDIDEFRDFFKSLNISSDAKFVTPIAYDNYLKDWSSIGNLPEIKIAVFGKSNGRWRYRRRIGSGGASEYPSFVGGKSDKRSNEKYIGDQFIDKSNNFHIENYGKIGLQRGKNDSILICFYKLNSEYINKENYKTSNKEVDKANAKAPVITYAIFTPKGGPRYKRFTNSGQQEILNLNESRCLQFEESLNINYE